MNPKYGFPTDDKNEDEEQIDQSCVNALQALALLIAALIRRENA